MRLSQILRVARYRFRGDLVRRRAGYLGVILVIGAIGGVALAALAGARLTESSFPTYVASTNPSTVGIFSRYDDPALGITTGYDPVVATEIAHLPMVTRSTTTIVFDGNIDLSSISGVHFRPSAGEAPPAFLGSLDGEFSSMDRVTLLTGRLADPGRADEAVMNTQAAQQLGVHVGSVIHIPFYTDAQVHSPASSQPHVATVKLVGVVILSRDVIESDDAALNAATVIFSPALTHELALTSATGTETFLQLAGGTSDAKEVFAAAYLVDRFASHFPAQVTTAFEPSAQQSVTPEALALAVFGAIAGLSVLLIAGLMISRLLRERSDDVAPMRALGADRAMLTGDALSTVTGAVVIGSLLAIGVAVALSPLAPLGPVRAVYPNHGVSYDWTVLGLGLLILVLALTSAAALVAHRNSSRVAASRTSLPRREPTWARAAAATGLPVSMETGVRLALGPGRGRDAAPIRSAIAGAVLAITVLVTAVTFGASLNNLVAHPPLYGWNWDYALLSSFAGAEDLPAHQVATMLDQDHDVQSWSGINLVTAKLDGQRVQVLAERPGATVAPPVLSGHALTAANEIMLGASTMASLHGRVGDTVTMSTGLSRPLRLLIVGTVSMPALTQMSGAGTGAVASTGDFPAALLNIQDAQVPGPNIVLIRIRSGVSPSAARRSLEGINTRINELPVSSGLGGGVISLLRPVEIVNFRSMGTTPAVLAGSVAAGALLALGLTLAAAVRRRRRELALLKTLGFTRRQLAESVATQAMVAPVVGVAIGMPLGIVIGRQLWLLFANSINVVPEPTVPPLYMVLIAAGAIILAIVAAALPGLRAAQTPAALALRAE